MVNLLMFGVRNYLKIRDSVVQLITVKMMDMLFACEWSAYVLFHNVSMFKHQLTPKLNSSIAVFINVPAFVVRVVAPAKIKSFASSPAEFIRIIFQSGASALKAIATNHASKLNPVPTAHSLTFSRTIYAGGIGVGVGCKVQTAGLAISTNFRHTTSIPHLCNVLPKQIDLFHQVTKRF